MVEEETSGANAVAAAGTAVSTATPPAPNARNGDAEEEQHYGRDAKKVLPYPPSPSSHQPSQPIAIANADRKARRPTTARQPSIGPPPGYALKRANNLFTASGLPSSRALQEALDSASSSGVGHRVASPVSISGNKDISRSGTGLSDQSFSNSSTSSTSSLGIGASLRRTLTEVKKSGIGQTLKRSLSGRRNKVPALNASINNGLTKHGRSFSEVGAKASVCTESEKRAHRRSATFPLSSGISEVSPLPVDLDEKKATQTSSTPSYNKLKMDAEGRIDADVKVPLLLQEGVPLTKISAKKKKTVIFRIDADQGYVFWESKKSGFIPIENIKEIRSSSETRYYREQFQISQEYESRWLTIVYLVDGRYKTLHAVASTPDVFHLWDRTLRALHAVRQELMSGLGHIEARQSVWEKRYWRSADEQKDDRLTFEEVEKMCRRLNLNLSKDELLRRFKEADTRTRGFLDFDDFRKFVRMLKERPEMMRVYKSQVGETGVFDFVKFEVFMKVFQKSEASKEEIETIFRKYATPRVTEKKPSAELPPPPPPSDPSVALAINQSQTVRQACTECVSPLPAPAETEEAPSTSSLPAQSECESAPPQVEAKHALSELNLTLEGFTNFLLSMDNSAFADQNKSVWQDMTRPLPEYYCSSSHNTYLVGHQLVGSSTIEGYIRALLHSCRSVEIDIYDGETEPVIYHGKTFTSKVPLRDICEAIAKYAFVASPYPVIISAEVHCSIAQQDLIASIMRSVFGDSLVVAPPEGRPPISVLPSPEDLKGRILLKAKNLYVTEREGLKEKKITFDTESSESSSSSSSTGNASDTEPVASDVRTELDRRLSKARNVDAAKEIREELQKPIKEIKEELSKARNLYNKVRRRKSPSPAPASTSLGATSLQSATLGIIDGTVVPLPSTTERERSKVKMSFELLALLVYTVGVKCRGFNKKESYAPEHLFSLSERTANKVIKREMLDFIKHNKTHLSRIYPNGTRLNSSNFEPHRFWTAGAQLVAINWQTFDLGYMINHSMFQRNGRAGYVLKPPALRNYNKELLAKRTSHVLELTVISAQQLPRRKDSEGREIINGNIVDPFVEVSIDVPDWSGSPSRPNSPPTAAFPSDTSISSTSSSTITARTTTVRTNVVKNNGFNPIWQEPLSLPFDCVGDMFDLIFLRFAVRDERSSAGSAVSVGGGSDEPLAVYCVSLGSLNLGYRHLPLHDTQLSQYLFSTLFVHVGIKNL